MSLPIQFENEQDFCIFCNSVTRWKNLKYNKPICIKCSKVHGIKDAILHKYPEDK